MFLPAIIQTLKYDWVLKNNNDKSSLIKLAHIEMESFCAQGKECWLLSINKIKKVLGVSLPNYMKSDRVGLILKKTLQSKFEKFWLNEINKIRPGPDNLDHSKLRSYKKIKCFFGLEPYISQVNNRNQSCNLSRLRTSSHSLMIERGRWSGLPISQRLCNYCNLFSVENEEHFQLIVVSHVVYQKKLFFCEAGVHWSFF